MSGLTAPATATPGLFIGHATDKRGQFLRH
jgi:hypothetical protein